MKKKILFITSDRSDFYLQKDLIIELQNIHKCYLFCTGTHFDKKFGLTIDNIKNSKIKNLIFSKIKNVNKIEYFKLHSIYLDEFNKIINKINPDLLILFGDRSEILICSFVAYSKKINIAHFYGGEVTKGSLDNRYRDGISLFSNYHFTSNINHKKNVINLGFRNKNVFSYGSLLNDVFSKKNFYDKKEVEKKYNIKLNKYNYVLTFHPDKENNIKNYNKVFESIKGLEKTSIFICRPNNDPGNKEILKLINKTKNDKNKIFLIKDYGTKYYFSLIKQSNGVIGNSSSGISEIPSLNKPSINIGNRQKGRPRSKSVIDVEYDIKKIKNAITKTRSKEFLRKIKKNYNPYFKKNAFLNTKKQIIKILA